MRLRMILTAAALCALPAHSQAIDSAAAGAKSRFTQGYEIGYQHGFQDGFSRGHIATETGEAAHQKAIEQLEKRPEEARPEAGAYSPQESFEKLSAKLGLSADQQVKIRPLLNNEAQEITAVLSDKSIPSQQKKERI